MTTVEARPGTATSRGRILGLDVARALAILGMVMVHFGPLRADTSTTVGWIYRTSYGRASILFVLLAGVGVTLLFEGAGRRGAGAQPPRDPRLAWTKIGWRVAIFVPLGIMLQGLDTPVAVILQYYGAYYLVAALASRLPTAPLVAVTATWMVIGPLAFVTFLDPTLSGGGAPPSLLDPSGLIGDLLLTGFYPVITWGPPVLVGVLVGRTDLRDRATQWALALGGAVTATAAYGASEFARGISASAADSRYLLAEGHSGAPLNVLGASGVAVAVLGVCLLIAAVAPRLVWPLAALGQMALTVYVGHLLILHAAPELLEGRANVADAIAKVARFYVITLVGCVAWRARFAHGPLEWLLAAPFTAGRSSSPPTPARGLPQPDARPRMPAPSTTRSDPWQHLPTTVPGPPGSMPSPLVPRPSPPSTSTSSSWSGTPPPSS